MVDHRRVRESDLANDLGPHVQRVTRGGHSSTRSDGQFRDDAASLEVVSVIRPSCLLCAITAWVGAGWLTFLRSLTPLLDDDLRRVTAVN